MKSAWFSTILLAAVSSLAFIGCEKNDDDVNGSRMASGAGKGSGGNNTINVYPIQKGIYIDSCIVYVKYNTEIAPLDRAQYDDSVVCVLNEDMKPVATFYELRKGTYTFYAYGWDRVRSQTVVGSRVYKSVTERTTTNLELEVYPK